MNSLEERLREIHARMQRAAKRSGRTDVRLVAVSKTVPAETIGEALQLGLSVFGENRVQEALPKIAAFPAAEWHFIGRLQTNKAKEVAGQFSIIQSLDRWRLAEALQNAAESLGRPLRVLLQVNIGEEGQKGGIRPAELSDFLTDITKLSHLQVNGLMTIPPYSDDPEEVRPYFREMQRLFAGCRVPGVSMNYLSMGMSNDFEVAIEEGANLVRVGSALFGERK